MIFDKQQGESQQQLQQKKSRQFLLSKWQMFNSIKINQNNWPFLGDSNAYSRRNWIWIYTRTHMDRKWEREGERGQRQ